MPENFLYRNRISMLAALFFASLSLQSLSSIKNLVNAYFRQVEQTDYGTQNDNPLTYDLCGHLWKIQGTLPGGGLVKTLPEKSFPKTIISYSQRMKRWICPD
ncbi:hypothetical protein PEDI_43570 [Persicobacter diffluens]|uniref:Uncharacterized protein n=2 Tax=Persicobacter diffluens TaxID=981 RepID=A0AAN5ALD0_9BACT|nr:hypothetical protein PEDI_43570 [Persicobacter diffluens]